jgi:hypothetical protein
MTSLNNLFNLIEPGGKKKFITIIFFNFITSLSEIMAIAAIYPFLLFIISEDINNNLFFFFQIFNPVIIYN